MFTIIEGMLQLIRRQQYANVDCPKASSAFHRELNPRIYSIMTIGCRNLDLAVIRHLVRSGTTDARTAPRPRPLGSK